jgi:polyhydroxybutyrate depolymerase
MPELPAGRHTIDLTHAGISRPYLLQVPPTTTAAGPRVAAAVSGDGAGLPLVLEIHGRGIEPVRFDEMTGFGALADEAGFALAMPAALGEIWNDGRDAAPASARPDDVGYLAALIDDVAARVRVDRRRIFAVGMSNGATMAGRLACERADLLAGLAQIAGTAGVAIAGTGRPARPVPILNVHGTGDRAAPYEGGVRRGLVSRMMIRHAAGPSAGVDEWARFWVDVNGAAGIPVVTTLPPDTTIRTWHGPTPASEVCFYRVEGAGHTWPDSRFALPAFLFGRTTRTFDATRLIWEFFAAHSG